MASQTQTYILTWRMSFVTLCQCYYVHCGEFYFWILIYCSAKNRLVLNYASDVRNFLYNLISKNKVKSQKRIEIAWTCTCSQWICKNEFALRRYNNVHVTVKPTHSHPIFVCLPDISLSSSASDDEKCPLDNNDWNIAFRNFSATVNMNGIFTPQRAWLIFYCVVQKKSICHIRLGTWFDII